MGLGNAKASRRSAAWRFFTHTFSLGSLLVLAFMFLPSTAAAQSTPGPVSGCETISVSGVYTLSGPIMPSGLPCFDITADNVTLNLSNFSINAISEGNTGSVITVGANTGVTIEGGSITTGYSSSLANANAAIEATGATNLTVTGVTIQNQDSSATVQCQLTASGTWPSGMQNHGTGIYLNNVAGGNVSANSVSCYDYGIYLQGSAVPSNGQGTITGNTVEGNTWTMTLGTQDVLSGGIVLDGSSGWTVNNNTVDYNGGPDNTTAGCNNTGTGELITCQFDLQVIHGSSGNSITLNTVELGFTGGIYAGPDVSRNSFTQNTLNAMPFAGLFSSAPNKLKNSWSKNSCGTTQSGGTVPHKACG